MIRMFKSLTRDERGASVIELALVTPFLGSMLVGMVDLSRAYSRKLQLEQASIRQVPAPPHSRVFTRQTLPAAHTHPPPHAKAVE